MGTEIKNQDDGITFVGKILGVIMFICFPLVPGLILFYEGTKMFLEVLNGIFG